MSREISPQTLNEIKAIAARYPRPGAALLPVLMALQRAGGGITPVEERAAAEVVGLNPVEVREAVTFYKMFLPGSAGRHVIRLCISLPCELAGSGAVLDRLIRRLGIRPGETTSDGRFTLQTVECLGNCDRAPCLMIDDTDHERVSAETVDSLLEGWK